ENWPQWRGPRHDGISHETDIPITWSKTKNVKWRLPLPGAAGATPVVWDDQIFLTSAEGDDLLLLAIGTNGQEQWRRKVTTGNQLARAGEGNSASATPATDGQHVWVFFGEGTLACYTVDGEEVWKFDVEDRYGRFDIQFGMTSTPVLDDGALYLQLIHGSMREDYTVGKVIKLDAATGKELWAVDRKTDASFECKHSYASPFLYDDGERQFLVTHGADCTAGYDLETGKELWRLNGLNGPSDFNQTKHDPTFRFVSSPGVVPGAVIVPTAKNGPSVALKVSEAMSGDITDKAQTLRWVNEKTPDVCIPLIKDGLVYLARKDGRLFCVDLETGEELYYERTHTSQHRSSPLWVDGHLVWCAKDGTCSVIKAGPKFELVASNTLEEPITASPIVANGTLYLRTYDALYAIKKTK
ncbi:MAG: PQQ-like beta-propeller repeat protein, partial [Planctomycetaceae bacterium]|nr:PQQ-like beta-propeller repeat protein [Planctomycetaceae bacterium]